MLKRRIMEIMGEPVGDAFGGVAYGERCDPGTLTMAATIATIVGGGTAAASALGIIGGKGGSGDAPTLKAAPVMPTPDDDAAQAAKKKATVAALSGSGRQSTILSQPQSSDLLGG